MNARSLRAVIAENFAEIYRQQRDGTEPPELRDDSVLLETGLDSLGFAILVTTLEEKLGFDPFTLSSEAYYPRSFGDFVAFYERNQPT
jgi:acyl carrier protein